jgi:hypothetical protein
MTSTSSSSLPSTCRLIEDGNHHQLCTRAHVPVAIIATADLRENSTAVTMAKTVTSPSSPNARDAATSRVINSTGSSTLSR